MFAKTIAVALAALSPAVRGLVWRPAAWLFLGALASAQGFSGGSLGLVRKLDRLPAGQVWLVPAASGVPVPEPSIRAAVDAALDGDVVLLSDGVFQGPGNRGIFLIGKNVEIRSESGDPSRTIIDCQGMDRAFCVQGMEITNDTLFFGLSIVRGAALGGGGILCYPDTAPIFDRCIFSSCDGGSTAGGLFCAGKQPAGVAVVRDCVFVGNRSTSTGGGALLGRVRVERCLFIDNDARPGGAGAGLFLGTGGSMVDSVIVGNIGSSAVLASAASLIDHCVIADTAGNVAGNGIGLLVLNSGLLVRNTILWGNESPTEIYQMQGIFLGGVVTVEYCDVDGGEAAIMGTGLPMPTVSHVLDEDPLFVDPANGDYSIAAASPCRDAGDPASVAGLNEGDMHNELRLNGIVDIGADELWEGLSLSLVSPGRAGEENEIAVRGAAPGALVLFFTGTSPGTTFLGFGACPDLTLQLGNAVQLTQTTASGSGEASFRQTVGSALAGATVFHQAVELRLTPVVACSVSQVVPYTYP